MSVLAWGLLVGGKLFDLRVLVGAWSAAPPESLSLLPYGPRWVAFDWLRVGVGMAGFVCSIRALSIPFPDSPIERGN